MIWISIKTQANSVKFKITSSTRALIPTYNIYPHDVHDIER